MSEKTLVRLIILLFLVVVIFQVQFKKRVNEQDIEKFKNQLKHRTRYISQYAPDFEITCLDGSSFKLSDQLGTNVIVINFFTTWCGPCRSEMPELQYFVDKAGKMPVWFIAISVGEDPETVAAYVKELKLKFRVAADEDKKVANKYCLRSYPTTVVIAPDGRIRIYEMGAIANTDVSIMPTVSSACQMIKPSGGKVLLKNYFKNAPVMLPSYDENRMKKVEDAELKTNQPPAGAERGHQND